MKKQFTKKVAKDVFQKMCENYKGRTMIVKEYEESKPCFLDDKYSVVLQFSAGLGFLHVYRVEGKAWSLIDVTFAFENEKEERMILDDCLSEVFEAKSNNDGGLC